MDFQRFFTVTLLAVIGLCYLLICLPGQVTDLLDLRPATSIEGFAIPDVDYRYIEEATIAHGWPMPFLTREAKLSRADCLPEEFASYPPFLVSRLWNPSLGYNTYTFNFQGLVANFVFLLILIFFSYQLMRIARNVRATGSVSLRDSFFLVLVVAMGVLPLAQFYRNYNESRDFENQCWQIGCSLNGVSVDPTFVRILGEKNVPDNLRFSSQLFTNGVSSEKFLAVLKNSKSRHVVYMSVPERQLVDDEFLRLITTNFSLEVISFADPVFAVDDLSLLNSIDSIHFFDVTSEQRSWIENQLSTSLSFSGAE